MAKKDDVKNYIEDDPESLIELSKVFTRAVENTPGPKKLTTQETGDVLEELGKDYKTGKYPLIHR